MLDEPLHVRHLQRVQDIPKIFTLRQAAVGCRVRHVHHKGCILLHEWPKLLHWKFIILRHVYLLDSSEFEQFLFLREQLFHEVSVQHLLRRHVQLQLVPEIRDEVLLRAEPREQLLSHDTPLLGANEEVLIHLLSRLLLLRCLHLLLLLLIMH